MTKQPSDFVHLIELRKRVLNICIVLFITVSVCFYFAEDIYLFLAKPLIQIYKSGEDRKLIFTGLTEGFFVHMKVALYSGFAMAFPYIATQLYFFVAPGLYKNEKQMLLPFLAAAPLLFIFGVALVYYIVMPVAWKFFLSFENKNSPLPIILQARVSEYLDLTLEMMMAFGIAFQMPIVLCVLAKLNIIKSSMLTSKRRHAIVAIFVVAAILTPPDVISQISLAIPLLILYELSIFAIKRLEKNANKNDKNS